MKKAILGILITSLFSLSAMAAPFVVEKVGRINWTVKDDECKSSSLSITNFQKKLYSEDEKLVGGPSRSAIYNLLRKIPTGSFSTSDVNFDFSEENSKVQIQDMITMAMAGELMGIDLEAKLVDIQMDPAECEVKGLFTRELACTATYTVKAFIDL